MWTREQLLSKVWGYRYFGGTRTVDIHVRRLRAKLGSPADGMIETVRNVGYKLVELVSPGTMMSSAAQCPAPKGPSSTSSAVVEVQLPADVSAAADVDDAAVELVADVAVVVARQTAPTLPPMVVPKSGPRRATMLLVMAPTPRSRNRKLSASTSPDGCAHRTPGSTAVTTRKVAAGPFVRQGET